MRRIEYILHRHFLSFIANCPVYTYVHTHKQTCLIEGRQKNTSEKTGIPAREPNISAPFHRGHFCLICARKFRSFSPTPIKKIISFLDRLQILNICKLIICNKMIVWLGIYLLLLNSSYIWTMWKWLFKEGNKKMLRILLDQVKVLSFIGEE